VYFQNQSNRGVNLFVNKIILILELGSTYRMSNVDEFIKITLDIKNPHRCYYKLCSSVIKMRGKLHVAILIKQSLNYSPVENFNPCESKTGLLADDAKNYLYLSYLVNQVLVDLILLQCLRLRSVDLNTHIGCMSQ
jgi:hypothetical protein